MQMIQPLNLTHGKCPPVIPSHIPPISLETPTIAKEDDSLPFLLANKQESPPLGSLEQGNQETAFREATAAPTLVPSPVVLLLPYFGKSFA